ncbi:GNAT family N-acetyltransferase [Alisedimentitalea sp. MJ-SS2]|uniref:GNAT family N-acetyltransferase n=1 Tax=Aliisedimentitalea sp. MJ-SS2 TaxID=3049795 RepID=UPI00290E6FBF|nr:GNAT family N-acetyltransferase [Alisedimentitalea sp. MJ-SS2]MDU8927640.1 GNAT family N-acetyltransferase [Alisedimentitalea sp. MJ-SS2]
MIIVEASDPLAPGPRTLLEASHALMESLYAAEDNHFLDLNELKAPNIHFFAARNGSETLGTGALAAMDGYGEVKSMFTSPAARGKGTAAAILRQIEDTARELDLPLLRLETGTGLDAAHRLYAKHGFELRGPFGDYPDSPNSIFMEKPLD